MSNRVCQTPETMFTLHTHSNTASYTITLPEGMEISEEVSKQLEEVLHDAAEDCLKVLF